MKTRKLLALALALVMTFSLASMAFATAGADITTSAGLATGGYTEGTGAAQGMRIKVTVPAAQQFVINPYNLTVKLSIDGDDVLSNDQIFCAPLAVVSESYVPIEVTAKVTGATGGDVVLKDTPEEADPNLAGDFDYSTYDVANAPKALYAFMAFASATSDEDGNVETPEFPTEYVEPEDGQVAETILVKVGTTDEYVVGTLSAETSEDGSEYVINQGNAIAFQVFGNANPFNGSWSNSDTLTLTTTFTFKIARD